MKNLTIALLMFFLSGLAVAQVQRDYDFQVPVGMIAEFGGPKCPTGWIRTDGTQVSRTVYKRLFAYLGTSAGQGDGTTTFHLPDTRGRVSRDVDGTAGIDPDKLTRTAMNAGGNVGNNVLSVQSDTFGAHKHETSSGSTQANGSQFNAIFGTAGVSRTGMGAYNSVATYFGLNTAEVGGAETRMENYYALKCIKY